MKRALVIGTAGNEAHEILVRGYFLLQSPDWTCDICMSGSGTPHDNIVYYTMDGMWGQGLYAIAQGYDMVIRSYTLGWVFKYVWDICFAAGIQVVHAHAANVHAEYGLPYGPPYIMQSAVMCGAGVTENIQSYGPGLEFFDNIQGFPMGHDYDVAVESYATPRIAGKLANIKDALGCSNQEARFRAEMTASKNGIWDSHDGYGIIDVINAIAYGIQKRTQITKTPLLAA